MEAAEAVGGDALDVLTQLVNKSLVTVERADVEQTRYRLLETIRQYAQDRLLERGEAEPTRDRHLNYFLQLAERAEPELRRADQIVWLDWLETELSNFRAALECALERERHIEVGLQLGTALMWFWSIRDHKREGGDWLERALSVGTHIRSAESMTRDEQNEHGRQIPLGHGPDEHEHRRQHAEERRGRHAGPFEQPHRSPHSDGETKGEDGFGQHAHFVEQLQRMYREEQGPSQGRTRRDHAPPHDEEQDSGAESGDLLQADQY